MTVDAVLFAAGDALGAAAGVARMRELDHHVLAAGGLLTASPLALQEARAALDVPVLDLTQWWDGATAKALLATLDRAGRRGEARSLSQAQVA